MKALLEKAGKNLNYGTLATAIDGLKVTVSGDPTPRVFGPNELDGNASAYLFNWDPTTKAYIAAQEWLAHEAASRAPAHPVRKWRRNGAVAARSSRTGVRVVVAFRGGELVVECRV